MIIITTVTVLFKLNKFFLFAVKAPNYAYIPKISSQDKNFVSPYTIPKLTHNAFKRTVLYFFLKLLIFLL